MATARIERRLAAIMAADVAGYSRLMGDDEAGTYARLKALRREVVEPVLARHGGRVVDLKGDGGMIEFASAVEAVQAAVEIQRAMRDQDPDRPEGERIRYRIGINLGDVIVDGASIYGDGVNVAARIEALCEPGGVWLARNVLNQVKGKLDLAYAPTGLHQVKNISEAVETYRIALDGVATPARRPAERHAAAGRGLLAGAVAALAAASLAGVWWLWPGEAPPERPGIAVLPFANMGGDEATGRLADGLTEDVITDLARFRDLDVIARNSTERYKGKPADIREVGKELKVGYVLEGSIQRQGDRLRVTAQLIDAGSDAHLWSQRWDRPTVDVFAVQAEVAEQVASALGGYGLVAEAGRTAAQRKRPADLTAYDTYLLGVEAKHRLTAEGEAEAARLLRRAVDLDPNLARAWTALSWSYSLSTIWAPEDGALRMQALDAAQRAARLDPSDAEAHAALGDAVGMLGDLTQARVQLEEALQLNPNHIVVLGRYAAWASTFGEPEKGAEAAERLIRLDPNYPLWAISGIQSAFFMAGRYEDALRALARKPDMARYNFDHVAEAASLAGLGRVEEARAVVTSGRSRFPGISVESWISDPTFVGHERARLASTMRAAGFPVCATADELGKLASPVRLPECEAERAKAVAVKS